MKIFFSPEYSGHVFIGLNEQKPNFMDTIVCDTMGLVAMLELRMGLHTEEVTGSARTALYFKALSQYITRHPNNVLAKSFELSGLDTAKQALHWRDCLRMDNWNPDAEQGSERLKVLAETEKNFHCPGLADRLIAVTKIIEGGKDKGLFGDLELVIPCNLDLMHPAVVELLTTMKEHGAKVTEMEPNVVGESNLTRVAQLLQSTEREEKIKLKLKGGDKSFLIYRFANENESNEYMSAKGDNLNVNLWVNGNNKAMDNWLRMMGKPAAGSNIENTLPQLVQLFVLGLEIMKEPLNIQSLIGWLYSPMQPMGSFFGRVLAEKIISKGGYRNKECRQIVENYIEGKYVIRDEEEEQKLTEEKKKKRDEKEKKERRERVATYLPSFEKRENAITATEVKAYLNGLKDWARACVHTLEEDLNKEGWISQLECLAQICETFVLLIDSSTTAKAVDWKQMESWVNSLYRGQTFMQYVAQKGCREVIDSPAKMAAPSRCTAWMNFVGDEGGTMDCSFLYPSERETLKKLLWDDGKESAYHRRMEMLPLLMTSEQLILVVTDYVGGELAQKHPLLVRLESQVENLKDFIVTPSLFEDMKTEMVEVVDNRNEENKIKIKDAASLEWPDHMSPTTLETFVEYPLDYVMAEMLHIVSTGPDSVKDIKATKGNVAHTVIEALFAPRGGNKYSTAAEIETRIEQEFEQRLQACIEARGAILYLPENKLEEAVLKAQLKRALDVLLSVIRDNKLKVVECEQMVQQNMGLGLENPNKAGDMKGFMDMLLEDETGSPVVFDFKWTTSKDFHKKLLESDRSIQLEFYRAMLEKEKKTEVKRVAYFLMPENHLYSKEHFMGVFCTQVQVNAENSNVVQQTKNSFTYRQKQIKEGVIEIGEDVPCEKVDYYNEMETKELFPLIIEDGKQKANIFSDYGIFKQVKEGK